LLRLESRQLAFDLALAPLGLAYRGVRRSNLVLDRRKSLAPLRERPGLALVADSRG
jgi:hypothetical protein